MLTHAALFFAVLFVLEGTGTSLDYCKDVRRDCGGGMTNLVCRRNNNCDATGNCKPITLHKDVKDFILNSINDIRNKVALGKGPIQGKTAADMRAMSWDEELEYIAQCAVNICETRLKGACPVASKFPNAHIIYENQLDVSFDDDIDYFNGALKTWLSYGQGMTGPQDTADRHYDFASLVVAKSMAMGCAWSRVLNPIYYHNYNGHFFFAACVFSQLPSGNVFVEGAPCSKCPAGTACNARFKGLCGNIAYARKGANEDDDYYDYHDGSEGKYPQLKILIATIVLQGLFALMYLN